jgi:DNA-binding IscR family transcriptional regulator
MTPSLLSDQIQMPERLVNEVAEGLESAGIVRVVEEDQDAGGALVMARDPASVQLLDVVEAVDGLPPDLGDRESDGVASILQTLRLAQANSPENLDIGALLERDSASEA